MEDMLQNAKDKADNDAVDEIVRQRKLRQANKTNAIIVDGIIYRKGEYILLSKPTPEEKPSE